MKTVSKTEILQQMFEDARNAPGIYHPSDFWQQLNAVHYRQITQGGFNNFKRSINMRYFNWGVLGIMRHQLKPVLSEISKFNISPLFASEFDNYRAIHPLVKGYGSINAFIYRSFTAFLYDYLLRKEDYKIINKLEEPKIGNPFLIKYKQRLISQDLCNSVHEFCSSTKQFNLKKDTLDVAELGAGYGRLAYVFLKTLPTTKYTIIDIPPALYVSQRYLTTVFPKEKIFFYRDFKSFALIRKEFEAARIRFLLPHQLRKIPDDMFNLFINVSSFHEMKFDQIRHYFHLINSTCSGYFYTKQWLRARVKDNKHIQRKDYPVSKKWKIIYDRKHPIQQMFFEALYKIN